MTLGRAGKAARGKVSTILASDSGQAGQATEPASRALRAHREQPIFAVPISCCTLESSALHVSGRRTPRAAGGDRSLSGLKHASPRGHDTGPGRPPRFMAAPFARRRSGGFACKIIFGDWFARAAGKLCARCGSEAEAAVAGLCVVHGSRTSVRAARSSEAAEGSVCWPGSGLCCDSERPASLTHHSRSPQLRAFGKSGGRSLPRSRQTDAVPNRQP